MCNLVSKVIDSSDTINEAIGEGLFPLPSFYFKTRYPSNITETLQITAEIWRGCSYTYLFVAYSHC